MIIQKISGEIPKNQNLSLFLFFVRLHEFEFFVQRLKADGKITIRNATEIQTILSSVYQKI